MNSFNTRPASIARQASAESALATNNTVNRKTYILLSMSLLFVALTIMAVRVIPM